MIYSVMHTYSSFTTSIVGVVSIHGRQHIYCIYVKTPATIKITFEDDDHMSCSLSGQLDLPPVSLAPPPPPASLAVLLTKKDEKARRKSPMHSRRKEIPRTRRELNKNPVICAENVRAELDDARRLSPPNARTLSFHHTENEFCFVYYCTYY